MQRARVQQAELGDLIRQIRTVLSKDEGVGQYFESELEWLDRREQLWQSDAFRIGLIGVTSSGKSTLVNALLGAELLPRAVRPSSNSLVVCEWGARLESVVHFNDHGSKPKVIIGSAIARNLARYGDEATNPGNRDGVEEIRLRSPDFKFGEGVALIDTPGLDAYGHDDHEKLTLEVLLPTVDVVVFVTTCKANSDEKMREYVCLAHDHSKPVIVVQNMIDSVVEKPGVHGEILKTRAEVLDEHRRRVEAVLKKAGVESVAISQVSAIWALRKSDSASGLLEFVASVQKQLDALAPAIAEGRREQLNTWLGGLIEKELQPGDPASILRWQKTEVARLSKVAAELAERYEQMKSDVEDEPLSRSESADELLGTAESLSSRSIREAGELQERVEKWLKSSAASLSNLNKQLNAQILEDCESLNLRADDINLSTKFSRTASELGFKTTNKSRTVRAEQSGVWGRFKRAVDVFDQDWGYDDRTETWSEIADLGAFTKAVEKAIKNELAYVERFVAAVVDRINAVSKQFRKELATRKKGIVAKMSATMESVHRKAIALQLETFLTKPRKQRKPAAVRAVPVTTPVVEQDLHEIDVEPAALSLARLATLIARRRFLDMRDQVLFDQALKRKRDNGRVLILGFDNASLGDFVNRFWFDMLEADAGKPLTFASNNFGDGKFSEIAVASLSDAASARTRDAVDRFLASPCVLFLVIDILQIGSTESMLERTDIAFGKLKHPVVIVVQSIKELEQSATVGEALFELDTLAVEHGFRLAGVLVNDEKIFYSMLANRLLASSTPPFETIAEEKQFIQSLPQGNRKEAVAIIRQCNAMAT